MNALVAAVLIGLLAASPAASGGEPFPVTIRVDAGRPRGPLAPIWRFFGADEPNYAYMKDGRKLLGELGELEPKAVYFRAHNLLTTGDGTPALKWGSHQRLHRGCPGQAGLRLDILDRIFDTYLERGVRPYVADRLHARGAVDQARALPAPVDAGLPSTTRSTPAGPTRRRTTRSGRSSSTSGRSTASRGTAAPRSRPGTGRSGTSRTSATGAARPRSSASSTTTPSTPCAARCPTARVGGPDTAGSGGDSRELPRALPARHQLRHRQDRHAARLRLLPRQGRAPVRRRPRPHGHRQPARAHRRGLRDRSPRIPELKAHADRHRRVRPRGLRRLPGAAARLPQRHDVLELHRRQLRPQARPRRRSTA